VSVATSTGQSAFPQRRGARPAASPHPPVDVGPCSATELHHAGHRFRRAPASRAPPHAHGHHHHGGTSPPPSRASGS